MKSSNAWKIGTGQPSTGLAGVVHPEPLVCRVSAAGVHQLGTEQAAHGPAGQEDGHGQIEGASERELGAAAPGEDDPGGDGGDDAAEGRQPAVPDGEDARGVVRVVAQIREHVHRPCADDGGQDDPEEDREEPVGGVAVLAQSPLEVGEPEPERDGEADAVGMDLEGPDVEGDGDGCHGWRALARLAPG